MSFGIVLLDQESPDKNSLMRNKKSMDRFSKLIKVFFFFFFEKMEILFTT